MKVRPPLKNGKRMQGEKHKTLHVDYTGSYQCIVTGACGTDTSNTIVVTVNPLPIAHITASGPTTFCKGGNVILHADKDPGLTYQWCTASTIDNNGGPISGATNSFYKANKTGEYSYFVLETDTNGCTGGLIKFM